MVFALFYICLCKYVCVSHGCTGAKQTSVEVRGQLVGVSFLSDCADSGDGSHMV